MKSRLIIFLGLPLFCFIYAATAQSSAMHPAVLTQTFNPRFNFKHLNVQNGLPQNLVYHFLQDSRGYMWIGTHNGLTLYDGIKTTNFLQTEQDTTSISGNFINSILEDSAQQIWIGQ